MSGTNTFAVADSLPSRPTPSELARSSGFVLLVRVLSVAASILFTSALSFLLSPADYGLVGMLVSTVLFAGAVGEFGQGDLMAREVSRALAVGAPAEARRLAMASTRWVARSGSAVGAVVVGALLMSGQTLLPAMAAGVMTVLLSVNGSWSGTARAHGRFGSALLPREVLWRGLTVGAIALLALRGPGVGAGTAVLCLLGALILALLAQRWALGTETLGELRLQRRASAGPSGTAELVRAGRDIAIFNLGGLAFVTLDVVIVGSLLGEELAAQYYPANRIAVLTFTIFVVLHLVLVPRMARAAALEHLGEVRSLARAAARIAAAGVLLAIGALLLARSYLPLVVATATDLTWIVAIVLSFGFLVNAAFGFCGPVLVVTGHESDVRRIMTWTLPLGAVALILAAYAAGPLGVALAVVVVTTVRLAVEALVCRHRLGFIASAV